MRTLVITGLLVLTSQALPAQTSARPLPQFEVASVKPGEPTAAHRSSPAGALGSNGRVDLSYVNMTNLMALAFEVEPFQISGPGWLENQYFEVSAKLPAGAPKEQVPQMLQSLLAERFRLKFHRESAAATPVYALTVAPGGAKLRPAVPDNDPNNFGPIGSPVTSNGPNGQVTKASARTDYGIYQLTAGGGMLHYEFLNMTMAELARFLRRPAARGPLDLPVIDMTELKGPYQIALDVVLSEAHGPVARPAADPGGDGAAPSASDPPGGSIRASLERQGLRLVRRSTPFPRIVVDQIERTPTAN